MKCADLKRKCLILILFVCSFALTGCVNKQFWAGAKDTDYWSKSSYKDFQTQSVMESCKKSNHGFGYCMIENGFAYADINQICTTPHMVELVKDRMECQSLKPNFKSPPRVQDCFENGEAARSDTCGGIPILHGKYFIRVVDAAGLQIPKSGNWQSDTIGGLYSGRNRSCQEFPQAQILFINENGRRLAGENPYQCDRSKVGAKIETITPAPPLRNPSSNRHMQEQQFQNQVRQQSNSQMNDLLRNTAPKK
jgi:hypothetical protein